MTDRNAAAYLTLFAHTQLTAPDAVQVDGQR